MSFKTGVLKPERIEHMLNSYFRYTDVNGRIISKQVLKNQNLRAWTGFTSFKIRNTIIIHRFLIKVTNSLNIEANICV